MVPRFVLKPRSQERGFTLIEVMMMSALIVIISGIGVALMRNVADGIKLGQAARQVERELQTARLKAVSSNQPMRVRFDCPVAKQYRIVELVGTRACRRQPTILLVGVRILIIRFQRWTRTF